MHKLNRLAIQEPTRLKYYSPESHTWDCLTAEDKRQVREALEAMQGPHCAYCEAISAERHIEHFRPKGSFSNLTFDWTNLFLSCCNTDSCGIYKDRGAGNYSPDDLINPCIDDPDEFLAFYRDGVVRPARLATPEQKYRAEETIRVFHLNAPHLVDGRKKSLRAYLTQAFHSMLSDMDDADFEEFMAPIFKNQPFPTALRHLLRLSLNR